MILDQNILKNITGRNVDERYITHLNTYMPQYDINTLPRIQFFIAIACGESGGFLRVCENMNYTSADRIKQVFGASRFQNEDIEQYVENPQLLANKVYGNKYGNTEPNDGWLYRGGGIFQLTFKGNYEKFARDINHPTDDTSLANLANNVREIEGAVRSACHYAKNRGILDEADKNTSESFIAACRKVGKCPDGNNYAKKREYWAKCKAHIGGNGIVEYNNNSKTENTRLNYITSSELNVFLEAKNKLA